MIWHKLRAWWNDDPKQDPVFWRGYSHGFRIANEALRRMRDTLASTKVEGAAYEGALLAVSQSVDLLERVENEIRELARRNGQPA